MIDLLYELFPYVETLSPEAAELAERDDWSGNTIGKLLVDLAEGALEELSDVFVVWSLSS